MPVNNRQGIPSILDAFPILPVIATSLCDCNLSLLFFTYQCTYILLSLNR